jgi:hypothetical protein
MISPLYFSPELYNNELSHSSINFADYKEWWEGFLAPAMRCGLYTQREWNAIA